MSWDLQFFNTKVKLGTAVPFPLLFGVENFFALIIWFSRLLEKEFNLFRNLAFISPETLNRNMSILLIFLQ